jgi:small subunit ribosomal protein S1
VELEEGVDGLVHISDLSWSKKIKHPAEFTKIGEELEVVVLEVDPENRRLSLGHKQVEENPWEVFETVFAIDSIHKGTIVSTNEKGVIVALPYGVEGFAPGRHLTKEDGSNAKIDETLDFKVIEFSKENKKIIVSHSKIQQDIENASRSAEMDERKAKEKTTRKAVKKIKDNVERTTLGDLDVLSNLKSEMEDAEQEERNEKKAPKKKAKEDVVEEPQTELALEVKDEITTPEPEVKEEPKEEEKAEEGEDKENKA